jgi:hypothetical protein
LGCGRKKNADPDSQIETPIQTEITEIFADSAAVVQTDKFFELEETYLFEQRQHYQQIFL